jgi:hypothetical protein
MARNKQQTEGVNLGIALQSLGFATAEQVTSAVAAQWSCPVFALAGRTLSVPVSLPRRLQEQYEFLPVHFVESEKRLTVGFVRRVEYQILSTIEKVIGGGALPCFITERDFQRNLHATRPSLNNEVMSEGPMSAAEIGRVGRNYVYRLRARAIRMGMCRDYLWMRLWSNQQQTDLLFQVRQG